MFTFFTERKRASRPAPTGGPTMEVLLLALGVRRRSGAEEPARRVVGKFFPVDHCMNGTEIIGQNFRKVGTRRTLPPSDNLFGKKSSLALLRSHCPMIMSIF